MTAPLALSPLYAVLGTYDVIPSAAESVRCPDCADGFAWYDLGSYGQTIEKCTRCPRAAAITRRAVVSDAVPEETVPVRRCACGEPVASTNGRLCEGCRYRMRQEAGRRGRANHPTSIANAARRAARAEAIARAQGGAA